MSITGKGIDAVLQFDPTYLKVVIRRELEEQTHCLDTQGKTVQAGDTTLRASDVTTAYNVTGFSSGSRGPTVDIQLTVTDGTLEAGPNAGSLQQTWQVSLSLPLSVRIDSSNPRVVELVAKTGIPQIGDFGIQVLDFADLDIHGVSPQPESNPGTVKRLASGTIAIGLLTDAKGTGTSEFENKYTDNEIKTGTDWALVLDHSMVETYVAALDTSIEKNSSIQNVKNLTLREITGSEMKIRINGKHPKSKFCSHANANLIVTNNKIDYKYHVTQAWKGLKCRGIDITGFLSSNDRNGRDTFYSSTRLSPPGVSMDMDVTAARTEPGELIIEGTGANPQPDDAKVAVTPDKITLGVSCSGGAATSETVTISHPKDSAAQVDLAVCAVSLSGQDANDFSVQGGKSTPYSIQPGSKQQHTITYTGQASQTARAKLEIATNAATKTLDMLADLGQGAVSVPGSKMVTGQQELTSCTPSDNSVETTVPVQNTGTGGVAFCSTPAITNSSGGQWSVSGAGKGDIIVSGDKKQLTVTFSVFSSNLGQQETATLRIDTSAGTHTVSLTGKVRKAKGQQQTITGDVSFGPIEIDHDTLCAGPAELGKYLKVWEEIHKEIFGDEELAGGSWGEVEPICCPPPQQPRCLCRPGMEVSTDGFPNGTRIEVRDSHIDDRAFYEPNGGAESFVVPLSPDTEFELDIKADESVDRSREVSLDIRRLALTREDVWESDDRITGVASDGETLAATTDGTIRNFTVDDSGKPNPLATRELECESSGIAGVDELFIAHGSAGYEAFVASDKRIERVASNDTPMDVLVADRNGDRERVGFAVRDDTLTVIDFAAPSDPEPITAAETTLNNVHAGFALGTQLALAGENGVEVWSIADATAPEQLGVIELPDVIAVFCDDSQTRAATSEGSIVTVGYSDGELIRVGGAELPEEWSTLLPRGSPAILGGRAVLRTMEADKFNVFSARVGRYGETSDVPQPDFDIENLPDEIAEAVSEIGMEIDDLLEQTVGVDLIEEGETEKS